MSCRPQGIKTSVVEKPRLMRASISPTLPDSTPTNPIQQETYGHKFQHVKDQEIQTHCFSSLHRCSLNLTSREISKKQERLWNPCDQGQSTKKQKLFSVKKWAQAPHQLNQSFTLPQSLSSSDHMNLQRDSKLTGYCKLSVYNGLSHSRGIQNNKQKDRQEPSEVGNYSVSNSSNR